MTRQLNLRVHDEFAERLERLSRKTGRSMAAVLEALGTPALEAAENDIRFEEDALAAWEEFELTGDYVTQDGIHRLFDDALDRARTISEKRGQ